MTLPSLQLAIGVGRVGKESGLMTCTELGRSRSSAQVAAEIGARRIISVIFLVVTVRTRRSPQYGHVLGRQARLVVFHLAPHGGTSNGVADANFCDGWRCRSSF